MMSFTKQREKTHSRKPHQRKYIINISPKHQHSIVLSMYTCTVYCTPLHFTVHTHILTHVFRDLAWREPPFIQQTLPDIRATEGPPPSPPHTQACHLISRSLVYDCALGHPTARGHSPKLLTVADNKHTRHMRRLKHVTCAG